jgi:hypothetical protein
LYTVPESHCGIEQFRGSVRGIAIREFIHGELRWYVRLELAFEHHDRYPREDASNEHGTGFVPGVKSHWSVPEVGIDFLHQRDCKGEVRPEIIDRVQHSLS